ncbi:LolA family protein, partial [Sphingomonas sp. STIS6.2]|uniref:LolA family protein n=1 Tax=Sphingomonas sp. STIS6.2 TaxID=1379700 RepID=UPI0018FEF044
MPASSWGLRRTGFLLRKAACAFALGIPLAAPVPVLAQVSPMVQVQQHLRAVDTMTAQFTQVDRNGRSLAGVLTLKRPGKVRFQYQSGVPLLVVGDGNSLIMIDYKVRQVSRAPISSSP